MSSKIVQEVDKAEQHVEIFKLKRLIKKMENLKGNGTALLTLIIPTGKSLTDIMSMLKTEYSQAASIQDKGMRDSVQESNIKIQNRLAHYGVKSPANGLVILAGKNLEGEIVDFIPWKRMDHFIFKSDDILHLEKLRELANFDEPLYGFIVIDGHSALFATIQGNTKTILNELQVNLPNKHNKGGQSSVRFARHYEAARVDWVKKVSEKAKETFLNKDNISTVKGLILAGCADFKRELSETQFLDKNLKEKIMALVDVSYGGQAGLVEALGRCKETLQDMQLNNERKLLSDLFDHLAKEDDMVVYGKDDTVKMLEEDSLQTVFIHDNSDFIRLKFKNKETEKEEVIVVRPADKQTAILKHQGWEITECNDMVDWVAEHASSLKLKLEFISDRSPEGNQFVKGFQGIAGVARFKIQKDYITGANHEEYKDDEDEDFL